MVNPKAPDKPPSEEEEEVEIDPQAAARARVEKLCKCDRILSESEVDIVEFGDITKFVEDDGIVYESSACNDDLEEEYHKLIKKLNLTPDNYSLTKIKTDLPQCLKYGFRSGTTHMYMIKFSPLTRGYQGPAAAVVAIASSCLTTPNCWNETMIDQIIEDADTYYSESYKGIKTDDRRTLTLLDLKRNFNVRNSHRAIVRIDDPVYAGKFRSETSKYLHVAKALDSFLKKHDSGVLTSSVLNIAIWKDKEHINIFDAQPRTDNCDVVDAEDPDGAAKLIMVKNLRELLFIILEKSNVGNEHFVIYKVSLADLRELSSIPDESGVKLEEPRRRASGYKVKDEFRAVVQGSFHLHHTIIPSEFHGIGHLVLAVSAVIYSKLLSASKWTRPMIDVMFNQSNIYLTDLARVLGKPLDSNFALKINELLCDVILGVYTAKIKVEENVVPGAGKKSKMTLDQGLRQYFEEHSSGVIEVKEIFYAIWRDGNKYYLFEPFACDDEGFRVNGSDPDEADRYKKAAACVTMNSTVDQLMETILENNEAKDKDPFIIHNVKVLYVKVGTEKDGSDEKVIYRIKRTNRRPQQPSPPPSPEPDSCVPIRNEFPEPRIVLTPNVKLQYPEMMDQIEKFVDTFDEEAEEVDAKSCRIKGPCTYGYEIRNCHRLHLRGMRNCRDEEFPENARGRQGLIMAMAAITKAKVFEPWEWTSDELFRLVCDANRTYLRTVAWMNGIDNFDANPDMDLPGLEYMDLSMLPDSLVFDGVSISFKYKMSVFEGETNPLANLGEALERYFDQFDELILENKRLFYAIWMDQKKYFTFNPYGADKAGWRDNEGFTCLAVTDSIFELVNYLYGVLEFNDYFFTLHYLKIKVPLEEGAEEDYCESIRPFDYEFDPFEKYLTKFLPLTDDDLQLIKRQADYIVDEMGGSEEGEKQYSDKIVVEEIEEEEEEEAGEEEPEELSDLFEPVEEPTLADAPLRLNLALVTGIVKLRRNDDEPLEKVMEVFYEKLKYRHPPPFVYPPRKNLCELLDVKLAAKSMNSLISRFSIDSKLATKDRQELAGTPGFHDAVINYTENADKSKLITLPPKKYFFSLSLPSGLTPIRAIDERYIRDKEVERKEEEACRERKFKEGMVMVPGDEPDEATNVVLPTMLPLGPCIATPKYVREIFCQKKRKKICPLTKKETEDAILKKIVCNTEIVLLELLLPGFQIPIEKKTSKCPASDSTSGKCEEEKEEECEEVKSVDSEPFGFDPTDSEDIGIINANTALDCREAFDAKHYKSCYFAAILCSLAKINLDVNQFRGTVLDRFIAAANKIECGTGKLRLKVTRWFRNVNILDVRYDVLVKQIRYGDPRKYEQDSLECVLQCYLEAHKTGILALQNVAYAFWTANDAYYLFDPYGCDPNGRACADGGCACLMKFCNFKAFIDRIIDNNQGFVEKPFRIYAIAITRLEEKKKKKKRRRKKGKSCKDEQPKPEVNECDSDKAEEAESEGSLIELAEWLDDKCEKKDKPCPDQPPGFVPIRNYNASAIEVEVLENEITRPTLAPLKPGSEQNDPYVPNRTVPYDRKFQENTALAEPTDLCIIAWSQIYEPIIWSVRTIQGLFDASTEYTYNSLFAANDTSILEMWDNMLNEFNIANYHFRVVFAPIHVGKLYALEGWNLAMSLQAMFDSPIYSGASLTCGTAQIGLMRKNDKMYAWWLVKKTKRLRIIVSEDMEDFLKLIVREIKEPKETTFAIRPVTISYAKMTGPDCSDLEGLHESMMPSHEIPEIHTKDREGMRAEEVFRPTGKCRAPVFLLGTVALSERDSLTEPKVKRCYFAALLAVLYKRELIQSPLPEMVDKVLEHADALFKLFDKPKFHTEHILKDVGIMSRVFDFRDCASKVTKLLDEKGNVSPNFFGAVNSQLRLYFEKCNSGVIHFTNCCYGFWYSEATNCYYYLDPYQCDPRGKRVEEHGAGCLNIFATLCDMAKQMCINHYDETTGFFIHRIHVEAVNPSNYQKFQEDPVWMYLDYHWSYRHSLIPKVKEVSLAPPTCENKERRKGEWRTPEGAHKPHWKNYLIEVPNLIYSLWGTIGAFDSKYGSRNGKNQAAIAVAVMAMQNLAHASEWNSAILDSAVVCGGFHYKESKRTHTRYVNRFNLSECLKLAPYLWSIEFLPDICGVLYGSKEQPTLASRIELAFKKSTNLLLQCQKKIVTVLSTNDGFYAIDASWTGPPLFSKGHGAIYVVRSANVNTLVYVLLKMLNTNQKLEFTLTPVKIAFKEDTCQTSESKPKSARKKLLDKPAFAAPGLALSHATLVAGSETVTDEDSYLCYSRNLKLGLEKKIDYENPPELKDLLKYARSCSRKRKRKLCNKISSTVLYQNLRNPRVVDLSKPKEHVCETWSWDQKFEIKTSFVCDDTRQMFMNFNEQMKKKIYKSYKHLQNVKRLKSVESCHCGNLQKTDEPCRKDESDDGEADQDDGSSDYTSAKDV